MLPRLCLILPVLLIAWGPVVVSAVEFEKPISLSARSWWGGAAWLDGDLWRVRDEVHPEDFTNHYVVDSIYGPFEASSDQQLLARLREIDAIRRLRQLGTVRAGGQGVREVAVGKLEVVESLASAPLSTVFDVPRGARAVVRRAGAFTRGERRRGTYSAGGPLRGLVGANDRKRILAARLEVDPYSDNEVLQAELERVALIEALPDFGVGLAIPGNGLFSLLDTAKEARMTDAYLASPSDLYLVNRETLRADLGVPAAVLSEFLGLPFTTPAQQTILVRSLAALPGVEHRDLLVELATRTTTRQQFDFYRRCAELIAWYQDDEERFAYLETFRWLPVGVTVSGRRVLPLAVDWAGWCADCGSLLSAFAEGEGEGEGPKVVLLTGRGRTPEAGRGDGLRGPMSRSPGAWDAGLRDVRGA